MSTLKISGGTAQLPPTKILRKDFLSAQLVEIGIAIQTLHGTYEAAEYLRSRKVNVAVATRALTQPLCRRRWREWSYPNTIGKNGE